MIPSKNGEGSALCLNSSPAREVLPCSWLSARASVFLIWCGSLVLTRSEDLPLLLPPRGRPRGGTRVASKHLCPLSPLANPRD